MSVKKYQNLQAKEEYERITGDLSCLPVSFCYDGRVYKGLGGLEQVSSEKTECAGKECRVFVLKADKNLNITLDTAYYDSHGAFEWTVWFKNAGTENTGIIKDVYAADMFFCGESATLKGIYGDHENFYKPYEYPLEGKPVNFMSDKGRPTHIYFPYFNLEYGDGGALMAIGWGGTWNASFTYSDKKTRFTAQSTNNLATYLKPGEKIRTALISILPYTVRDENYATNLWRSWYLEHNIPKANARGDALTPLSTCCFANDTGLPNSDGSISERHYTWKPSVEKMLKEDIHPDFRWVDAGWYSDPEGNTIESNWWGDRKSVV